MPKKREREDKHYQSDSEETITDKKVNVKKAKITEDDDEFKALGISESIQNKLKEKSIVSLFEVQKKVYGPIYEGKNLVCASLTGSGKTLSFVLPIIQKNHDKGRFKNTKPIILVMAPTRELSIQVGRVFNDLISDEMKYKVALIYGGVSIEEQIHKLRGGVDVIVGTPGRIIDMIERGELSLKNLRTVVLDEADKMLSMGFEEQIQEIFDKIYKDKEEIQVCFFSATIDKWVHDVVNKITRNNKDKVFIDLVKNLEGRTPKTVQHLAVKSLKSDKITTIADLILCYGGKNKSTIVFVNTKRECNDLMISDKIKQEVQIVHGDINQKQREATIEGFTKGKFKCLVATDVASRGLDIPMVDLVIQSEPPKEVDSYIHRAGRTARAGRSGTCITLFTSYTEGLIQRIEQKAKIKFKRIGAPQRNEIVESSIRDITTSISNIDDSMIKIFQSSATKLIEEYGAENALARLFAFISGHTEKMKSRSLLCGAEGFVTYAIKFNAKFNHAGYIWGFFKRMVPDDIKQKIRGMKPYAAMDGCVFDIPEDDHTLFEEIIYNDKLYGINYTLSKPETLPELADDSNRGGNSYSNGGYNGNHSHSGSGYQGSSFNRNASTHNNKGSHASRSNRLDIFIGNIPNSSGEDKLKQWIGENGINTDDIEIRFAKDKDTNNFRGFGFASVYDAEKLNKVVALNGKFFNGRALRINDASKK
jgi:ATP-dependent RNA helicase DDX21